MTADRGQSWAPVFVFLALGLLTIGLAPLLGPDPVPWRALWDPAGAGTAGMLVWQIRLPRVLLAFAAGTALALGGTAFQALFRNPLATPHTLGVSSAASLGAVVAIRHGGSFGLAGAVGVGMAAFAGALACIGLVWALVQWRGGFSTVRLLLAGVAISFITSSLIMFVHYTSNLYDGFRMMRHLMGSLAAGGFESVWIIAPVTVLGFFLLAALAWELDLISLGEDLAASRGVPLARLRWLVFFGTCFLEAVVVAVCGPIGFIGLMVPHMVRIAGIGRHRRLLPLAGLGGGILLTVCDTAARIAVAPAELPVGVITALLGGPFFLWLLLRRSGAAFDDA